MYAGRLPTGIDLAADAFDIVWRRAWVVAGTLLDGSVDSLSMATKAARFAPLLLIDFRRVTRWVGLSEPAAIECELVREWVSPGRTSPDLTGCWVSWRKRDA